MTLAWGFYPIIPCLIGIFMFFWSFLSVKKSCPSDATSILVALLFSIFSTLSLNQAVMSFSSFFGSKKRVNFELIYHNKSYEKWSSREDFSIECISTSRPLHAKKNAEVSYFFTGIIRMKYTEICIPKDKLKQDQ